MFSCPPTFTLFPYTTLFRSYDIEPVEPTFPIRFDPAYGEICLRGMSRMIPALGAYLPRLPRSEEHTSELQSHSELVCRLLLEKKKDGGERRSIQPVVMIH